MSRLDLITVAIVIICLGALVFLGYKIWQMMNPPTETPEITTTYEEPTGNDEPVYTDVYDDEVNSADSGTDLDDDELPTSAADETADIATDAGDYYDENELDKGTDDIAETNTYEEEAPTESVPTPASTTQSASYGKYMVLAGSYRQRSNADAMVSRLRNMGYSNAEVNLFDRGSFAVAVVDRFGSYGDAKRLVNELGTKGVDALVQEKN